MPDSPRHPVLRLPHLRIGQRDAEGGCSAEPVDDDTEDAEVFQAHIDALHAIEQPVTDEEATLLATCFGDDNCFGVAWTLLHLIETAPTPLVMSEPPEGSNEWIILSWRRYKNYLAIHPA